jgi:DNA-binding MarR family transcriptional regulator
MSSDHPNPGPFVGAMLRPCWQWVREQIFMGVLAAGYDDLNPAHIGLFRYPTLDRQRPSELAEQFQITRQSINDLLGHLEQCGYITRETAPGDRRARVVRLTAKGRRLEKTINAQARAAELEIADVLGPRHFAQLRSALDELARHIANHNQSTATAVAEQQDS